MKKTLFLLLFFWVSSEICAQNKNVLFENIPFEETTDKVIRLLTNNGFIKTGEDELTGDIDSYGPCIVTLLTTPENSDSVGGIGIRFPDSNTWQTLHAIYSPLKEKLNQKYGTPFLSVEKFTTPSQPVTNEEKSYALNQGEYSYQTLFILPNKILVLAIGSMEENRHQVILSCINKEFIQTLADYQNTFPIQETPEHLLFKGIPITGSRQSFVDKLQQLGFKPTYDFGNSSALQGAFAGYDRCNIYVMASKREDLVHTIGVTFPERDKWSLLSSNYFSLKELLIQKYGNPTTCVEMFQSEPEPDDDQMKMLFTNMDKCIYKTTFETHNGTITLSIVHSKVDFHNFCYINLLYTDRRNLIKATNQALNDL